ncbi:hypothetical protein PISMIDRAFT_25803 [Pisolithus microcarpus 441]|uniref:Uncharacterized protein n=1 Tax=Pisolithus microcarpus 441 TaxID=765257 RepID=A0A0C9XFW2_9AGAM|nr:hypothetical protein PISMIDRAFT_25803 [Pisolithus microcarpus 441]
MAGLWRRMVTPLTTLMWSLILENCWWSLTVTSTWRYISANEACHNIFEFPMHQEWPAVYCLAVHLPDHQVVAFNAEDQLADVIENARDSPLLGWFKANADPVLIAAGAREHLYQDFPKGFVWMKLKGGGRCYLL